MIKGSHNDYMEEMLECDHTLESDDPALNGNAVVDSDCYVKCKETLYRSKNLSEFIFCHLFNNNVFFRILDSAFKPGAEFKDADIETNDRFVERNGQIMYRMTCKFHRDTVRIVVELENKKMELLEPNFEPISNPSKHGLGYRD